ncbi:MAG: ATP-binding response regulator [Desulfobaccales bacterium]
MMRDNRQSQNPTPPAQPEELDLIHLIRSLELANLELDRVHRWQREFLANTSHELRTPLNAILSFLRLVMDGLCDSPEEARQFVHSAYDSARSLLDLINEHLDSAEIEAGKLDLQLTEVNVAAVFEQVEKSSRRQADQRKVRLTFRAPRTRVLVRADAVNLSQVLLNLVANAIQSTTQGEVRVQARSWRDQGHVRFQVRSLGWSPEKQGNLFHRADPTIPLEDRRNGEANAVLAECKTLVECMGGQIWLSTPCRGQGASVSFTLPLVTPQPLYWRRTADRERGLDIQGPPTGPLILLVEDEPKVLDKLARILQKHGYRTAYAVTADDGLEGAQRLEPDLITLDLGLPVRPLGVLQSGLDLYDALQRDPHLASIPVIMVTGHDPALTQPPQTLPPILSKPFRAQQLLDLLADQLRGVNLLSAQG